MAYKRKTWQQKLHNGLSPKVELVDKEFAGIPAGASMYVGTPEIVEAYIRNIPTGTHTTLQQMRKDLAAENNAGYCCPITSGIFLRIVAEASYEAYTSGTPLAELPPFWRMIDRKSPVVKKVTFDPGFIKEQRDKEYLHW